MKLSIPHRQALSDGRTSKSGQCDWALLTTASRHRRFASCKNPLRPQYVHSRLRHRHASIATQSPSTDARPGAAPEQLVDELLERIKNSDSGVGLHEEEEATVNKLINQLEAVGKQQEPRPLDNSLIFGNFGVAFSSTQQAPKQSGQPAGGGFRSKPGRLLFQTKELCQSIFKPNLATNKVAFALLGCIPGSIGLRGTFAPQGDEQDTVKVDFEPPTLSLPGGICLAVGPTSSVVLATTYLDKRVRLGRGGRGSSFVFTRGGPCESAGMEEIGLARTSALGYTVLLTLAATFCTVSFLLLSSGTMWSKVIAAPPALLGVAILFGLWLNIQFGTKSKQ